MKKTKNWKKIFLRTIIIIISIVIVLFIVLFIYSSNPYTALPEMQEQIDLLSDSGFERTENSRSIQYTVTDPIKNVIFIPGGLVTPNSYEYLAVRIALAGYDVTIIKPYFYLAIFTPNQAEKYFSDDLDDVVIGHSLGGVTASIVSSGNEQVSAVVMLGSYPIQDLTDKDTLIITAEYDIAMDQEAFDKSLVYVNDQSEILNIEDGNHAQFGWYGPQKGDGAANIDTLTQQNETAQDIIDFLGGLD